MKKSSLIHFVVGIAITVVPLYAREPQAPPAPSVTRSGAVAQSVDGTSLFVGHYGETIAFPANWIAEVEMRNDAEVVFFHRKFEDELGFKPLLLKKADYTADHFPSMGLELVILPKDSPGGLGSLAAIRNAKELELKKLGADYQIFEETGESGWPRATFHIRTNRPYVLRQTYSESPGEFYILTHGGEVEAGKFALDDLRIANIYSARKLISESLRNSLQSTQRKTAAGRLFEFRDEAARGMISEFRDFIRFDGSMPAAKPMTAVAAIAVILALWPGKGAGSRRARLFGRSAFCFTLLGGLLGFLVVYLPARFAGALWKSDELAAVIPLPMLSVIAWSAARSLGSKKVKRVTISTAALATVWAVMILWGANMENLDHISDMASINTFVLLVIGLTFGIVFAAALGPLAAEEAPR